MYFPTISERVPDIVVALSLVPLLFIGNPLGVLSYALPPYVVVMVVRAISMLLTTLPAIEDCDKDKKGASSVLGNHCYDLNVSGHYTIVACLVIAYVHFGIVSLPPAIMWMAVAAFGIISARSHYSVDVFLAGILSFSAFKVVY